MGLLSGLSGSAFDPLVDKATSEENTSEDWALIMDICDRVTVDSTGAKECLRSILRRLNSPIPVVLMQCLTLTDALVSNCGKKFHLEVCSRDFETALRNIIASKQQPKVSERARLLVKKWAKEFKSDPQLSLMPALYERLKKEGVSFSSSEPKRNRNAIDPAVLKNPDAVSSAQEEADILKAIELSLKETKGGGGGMSGRKTNSSTLNTATMASAPSNPSSAGGGGGGGGGSSLYPTFSLTDNVSKVSSNSGQAAAAAAQASKEPIKVRALYDFEAAEDNELTFKAGEIILVSDSSDANWWKGSNHRGEGLFPANFVSTDLNAEPEPVYKPEKRVQFNEEIKVKVLENSESGASPADGTGAAEAAAAPVEIDESRIDRLLHLLHEADPQSENCDTEELLQLEEQCVAMMPLIDQQIELIDKRHATLTTLNGQLNSALNLYHDLMKESFQMDQAAAAAAAAYASMGAGMGATGIQPGMAGQMAYPQGGGGGGGYVQPPPPYHPSMQAYGGGGAPAPAAVSAGYYAQQPQSIAPPNMAYQQQQQPQGYPTISSEGQVVNGIPHHHQQQQQQPNGPFMSNPQQQQHQLYQSPTHLPQQQQQQPQHQSSPQQQQPQQYHHHHQSPAYTTNGPVTSSPYTPEHHHHLQHQQPQPQQMMMMPPATAVVQQIHQTPTSAVVNGGGVMMNQGQMMTGQMMSPPTAVSQAVPNLL